MSKKSKDAYEKYLNEFYKYEMNLDSAVDALIYLLSKKWCMKIAERKITWIILDGRAGSYLRVHDPIRFNVGYREWIA